MTPMKVCCLCFTPKTGTVILGCLGILLALLSLVPHCLILEDHNSYISEFVKYQRATGARDIRDEDIPMIRYFSKVTWALMVTYDVTFALSSMLLIAAVAADKRFCLVPWLFFMLITILFIVIGILSVMFSLADYNSVVVLFSSAPPLILLMYLWYSVYSTFHQMKLEQAVNRSAISAHPIESGSVTIVSTTQEERHLLNHHHHHHHHHRQLLRHNEVLSAHPRPLEHLHTINHQVVINQSPTNVSITSVKESQNSLGGTPPPPYETLALETDSEEEQSIRKREQRAVKARHEDPNRRNRDETDHVELSVLAVSHAANGEKPTQCEDEETTWSSSSVVQIEQSSSKTSSTPSTPGPAPDPPELSESNPINIQSPSPSD